jgi:ABC-type sugar transport system permease subunit/ABC-type glycerol-3-phosphate transport system substrate-binding protein
MMRHPALRAFLAAFFILTCSFASAATVLRLSVWDGDKALETVRKICADFEKENPGVKIKIEPYPDYNLYHQKMLVTYAAGVAPDVVMMDPANFQALAVRKALIPLNQFFEKTPGFSIKDYYKQIVDAHSYKRTVYVLPRDIAPSGLIYYNKRLFKEKGIPFPDGSWTWDFKIRPELKEKDFFWVAQQFIEKNEAGKQTRWGYTAGWPSMVADTFAFSTGALPYDNMEEPKKVQVSDPKYIRAFQHAADISNKWHVAPTISEQSSAFAGATAQALFIQQRVAMYQNGIWEVPQIRKMLVPGKQEFFEWDIALAPAYAGEDGTPNRKYTTGGSGYGIMASTKNPDLAWKLTQFLSGEPGMVAMAKAGIAQPAITELAIRPGIWCPGPETPAIERYPANRIATHQAVEHVVFSSTSQYSRSLGDRINRGLELVWNGQKQAKDVLTENQKLGQDRLDQLTAEESLPPYDWNVGIAVGVLIVAGICFWIYKPHFGKRLTLLEKSEARSGYKFLTPWIIGLVVFTLGPMILSLLMSFADWDMIRPARNRGLMNFKEAGLIDPSFWKSLWVTFIYTIFSVPLGIFGSMMLALLLNQKIKGVSLFRTLYYIPSITSAIAAALIWLRVFNPETGLLNFLLYGPNGNWPIGRMLSSWLMTDPTKPLDWLALESTALPALIIMSLWGIGGGTVIFLAGLQGIPQYYYEAATLDGAGIIDRFKKITFPMLTPTIFFSMITGMVGAFQAFSQAFVMTQGGPNDATRFYVFHLYGNAFQSLRMGYASALGWVLFLIIMVITLIQIKASKWVYYEADAK